MPWIKLDDGYADHPKIAEAGPLAAWLHTKALIFCGRHLTDGRISRTVVASLIDWRTADVLSGISNTVTNSVGDPVSNLQSNGYDHPDNIALADRLVEIGLWERHENGLAYRIHDYLEYQPSRAEVLAERKKNRERVKRHREREKANRNAITNTASDTASTSAPYPTRSPKQKKPEEADPQLTLIRVSNAVTKFDFEAVYALYPRKEGKTRGLAKCEKQIKSREDYERLLMAVKHYAESAERPYVKHFDTFMGEWRDWIEKPSSGAPIANGKGRQDPPPIAHIPIGQGGSQDL